MVPQLGRVWNRNDDVFPDLLVLHRGPATLLEQMEAAAVRAVACHSGDWNGRFRISGGIVGWGCRGLVAAAAEPEQGPHVDHWRCDCRRRHHAHSETAEGATQGCRQGRDL